MNTPVFNRRNAERFNQLLDEADGARRHHTRSPLDDELAELVVLGHQLSSARPAVNADPDFRAELRAMLVATAEREGIGTTATAATGDSRRPTGRPAPVRRPRPVFAGHRGRTRVAIIAAVAAGAIAVSGMSTASENSLPGDALYSWKRSTERAQLALTGSDLSRGYLLLDFARTRLSEAEALRDGSASFVPLLDDMDAATRQGVKFLATAAVQTKDQQPLDAITAFLADQRGRLQELLDQTTGVEHRRLLVSDALLGAVGKRVEVLRRTLACGPDASGRADDLGPLPHACTAGSGPSGIGPGFQQQDQRTGRNTGTPTGTSSASASPEPTDPAVAPSTDSRATPGPVADPGGQPIPTPNGTGGRHPLNRALG